MCFRATDAVHPTNVQNRTQARDIAGGEGEPDKFKENQQKRDA
jgi:hypothetical protein